MYPAERAIHSWISCYVLVDYTGRLFRDGKTAISAELSGVFDRLRAIAIHAAFPGVRGPNGARGQ